MHVLDSSQTTAFPEPAASSISDVFDCASQFAHRFSQHTVMQAADFASTSLRTQVPLQGTDKPPEHELHNVVAQR